MEDEETVTTYFMGPADTTTKQKHCKIRKFKIDCYKNSIKKQTNK